MPSHDQSRYQSNEAEDLIHRYRGARRKADQANQQRQPKLPAAEADQTANATDDQGAAKSNRYGAPPAEHGNAGCCRLMGHTGSATRNRASAFSTPSAIRRGRSPRPNAAAGLPRTSTSISFVRSVTSTPSRVRPRRTPEIGAHRATLAIVATTAFSSTRSPIRAFVSKRPATGA